MDNYGIDWEGPSPAEEWDGPIYSSNQHVQVPETVMPLSIPDFAELVATIDPCQYSEFHGVDVYIRTQTFVEEKVSQYGHL